MASPWAARSWAWVISVVVLRAASAERWARPRTSSEDGGEPRPAHNERRLDGCVEAPAGAGLEGNAIDDLDDLVTSWELALIA